MSTQLRAYKLFHDVLHLHTSKKKTKTKNQLILFLIIFEYPQPTTSEPDDFYTLLSICSVIRLQAIVIIDAKN